MRLENVSELSLCNLKITIIIKTRILRLIMKRYILVGISIPVNSKHIINVINKCKTIRLKLICLLCKDGGIVKSLAEQLIRHDSEFTARTQEMRLTFRQTFCNLVEHAYHLNRCPL